MSNAFFQNSFYVGNTFNAILYGVELMLYAKTMHTYATSGSRHERSALFFMCFSTVSLILITIFMVGQSILGEEMWIVNANYPGGSAAYLAAYASVWYQTMGTTASIILQLMSDGLLIYRCLIVWRDRRIIILPCFLWLATLAFGILELYVSGTPNANFFVGLAAHIAVTYAATSIGLNVLVTCLICGRILFYARFAQKQLGQAIAETYFSIAAIIIESALPYTLCGVAFLVSFGLNSEISILFLSFYIMFTCISPQMLILRVASGRAWDSKTATRPHSSSMFFSSVAPTTTIATTSRFSAIHLDDVRKATSSQDEESGLEG